MSKLRGRSFCLWIIAAGWGVHAAAQESESAVLLLRRTESTLTALPYFEVNISSRETIVEAFRTGRTGSGPFRTTILRYTNVVRRLPSDWRIVSEWESKTEGDAPSRQKIAMGRLGTGDGEEMRLRDGTTSAVRAGLSAENFLPRMSEEISRATGQDLLWSNVLRPTRATDGAWPELAHPMNQGTDVVGGVRLVRVVGKLRGGKIFLWIDEASGFLKRVVRFSGVEQFNKTATETFYDYDAARGAEAREFILRNAWNSVSLSALDASRFASSDELATLASSSAANEPPGAAAPTPVTPAVVPAAEEQSLTAQQMQAIVLVEGEEGVGSGFVARIRDVNFVVTNQHVIGGNDKLRVTTVSGVPIKIGAIFGAVGRDIAILRIEGDCAVPPLTITADPLQTAKLGDKVAVVGNRRGGGVATQVSGVVRGFGPEKIEVDAQFQPGNSGSPIIHVASGEVIGLATYSQTRKLDMLDGANRASGTKSAGQQPAVEQRWFGFRVDGVTRWEAIDLAKWRVQAKRVSDFAEDTEAIYYAIAGRFKEAATNPRIRKPVDRLSARLDRVGSTDAGAVKEFQEFFRSLRAMADVGVKELKTGDYYDYFRTSFYWETSITEQLRAREEILRRLDKQSENADSFLSRLRR